MTYYAVIKNNIVENVVLSDPEYAAVVIKELVGDEMVEVTENTKPAQIGHLFIDGKFVAPQPFNSWIFDEEIWQWKAPVAYVPDITKQVTVSWDEDSLSWIETPLIIEETPAE